jgi:hypothetical protein
MSLALVVRKGLYCTLSLQYASAALGGMLTGAASLIFGRFPGSKLLWRDAMRARYRREMRWYVRAVEVLGKCPHACPETSAAFFYGQRQTMEAVWIASAGARRCV